MARRKLTSPTKAVTYRIDKRLSDTYDLLLQDPVAKRGAYGKKSVIVEALLNRLLIAVKTNEVAIDVSDLVKQLRGI